MKKNYYRDFCAKLLMRTKIIIEDVRFYCYRICHDFWKNCSIMVYFGQCWFQARMIPGPGRLMQNVHAGKLFQKSHKRHLHVNTDSVFHSYGWLYVMAKMNCCHSTAVCGLQREGVNLPAAAGPGDSRSELAACPLLCLHAGSLSGWGWAALQR